MATDMEQVTMNHTPGWFQEKALKNLFQSNLSGELTFEFARLISLPNSIGSINEKPILIAAKKSTNVTSHLWGFR